MFDFVASRKGGIRARPEDSVMSLRRTIRAGIRSLRCLLAASHADAITLTLAGPEPESVSPVADLTSTIWASTPDGILLKIAAVGATAPGGGTFSDMGVPSIAPDSQVIFGAEVSDAKVLHDGRFFAAI